MSRLIDADALLQQVSCEANFLPCGKEATEIALEKWIKSQPTAYDVEKVVEELDSAENYYYDDVLDEECDLIMVKSVRQDVAIDIVRKGGVE